MNYTVIRPEQADVGMLVLGTIFDRVIIAIEQDGLQTKVTFDDLEIRTYEPYDILHVQAAHQRRYEASDSPVILRPPGPPPR